MKATRYHKRIIILGCVLALGICFFQPVADMPKEEVVSFLEPRIQFLKSVQFTIVDHGLDMVLNWIKPNA